MGEPEAVAEPAGLGGEDAGVEEEHARFGDHDAQV